MLIVNIIVICGNLRS